MFLAYSTNTVYIYCAYFVYIACIFDEYSFCIFSSYKCIFCAYYMHFLHISCMFMNISADPFQLARLLAVPVPFQLALQQQVHVHS